MNVEIGDKRYDKSGPIVVMAISGKYIMARRPRCYPFILMTKGWQSLSVTKEGAGQISIVDAMRIYW